MPGGELLGLPCWAPQLSIQGSRGIWDNTGTNQGNMVGVDRCPVPDQWSPAQPLWGNPTLSRLRSISDPQLWARFGITTLDHIMPQGLKVKYNLPTWMAFRYLQLKHATGAQFPRPITLKADPIEELLAPGDLTKPLSTLYSALLGNESPKIERLWETWTVTYPH